MFNIGEGDFNGLILSELTKDWGIVDKVFKLPIDK